jgi:aspartyl-tRNA(Asn)/glutamyl-tRNA(Gln) amidotransferase subunit A
MAGEEPETLEPVSLAGLRIGVPRGSLFEETEPVVAEGFERSLARVSEAGASIFDHDVEDLLSAMAEATSVGSIASVEAAAIHAEWLDTGKAEFDPRVHGRIARGREVPASAYIRMMRQRAGLIASFDRRLASLDVLALPATATTAPLTAPLLSDDDAFTRTNLLILRNTMVSNLFDLTGISVPMPNMMRPAGFMLLARHGEDRRLLKIAAGVELVLGS